MASKRKAICVDEKVCVIRAIEKGEKKSDVGRRFKLSQSTVATIWKNKETILQAALEGNSSKKLRKPKFEDLDQAMLSWFHKQRQNNVPISGPIVKAKAEKFADQLGIIDFKASEGWLGKFKHRHQITYGKMNGEARDVDTNVTDNWNSQTVEMDQFDSEDNLPLSEWISQFNIPDNFNKDLQSYENIDEDVATTDSLTDEQIVDLVSKSKENPNNDDEEDDQVDEAESPPTIQQALDAAKLIETFLLFNQDDSTTYLDMNRIHKIIQNKYWHSKKRQTKLTDYMCK